MTLSPAKQQQVQACGDAIRKAKINGDDVRFDLTSCISISLRESDEIYQCLGCGIENSEMASCAACHAVPYCNIHCQKKDWKKQHRHECKYMREAYQGLKAAKKV